MPLDSLRNYAGAPLSEAICGLLLALEDRSYTLEVSGSSRKTIRVRRHGRNVGYVNGTVIERGGVVGYHFAKFGRNADACPEQIEARLSDIFRERYGCESSTLDVHHGSGSNAGNTYLIIRDEETALRILAIDEQRRV